MTEDISTHVSQEICILQFVDLHGQTLWNGLARFDWIVNLLKDPSIGSIHIDIWRRSSGMVLTITVSPTQWPNIRNLMHDLLVSFSPNTSPPSPLTSVGTHRSQASSLLRAILQLLPAGVVGFLVAVT